MSNEQAQPEPFDEPAPELAAAAEPAEELADEPVANAHAPVEVELRRTVRHGRIIIGAVVLGILVGVISSLFFPVVEGANYELGQIAGLMAVVGGAIGLVLGALLSLLLGMIAGRKRGAALAVQTDVR